VDGAATRNGAAAERPRQENHPEDAGHPAEGDSMHRTVKAGLVAVAAVVAGACAATTFNSTWRAPVATARKFKGKKVAAIVMTADESVRYGAEDSLAREITARGAVGIPSYSLIPKELTKDKDKAKEFLEKANVVGAVVMRVVGKDQQLNASAGGYSPAGVGYWGSPVYTSFYGGGFYGYGWGGVYMPGYVQTDTIISVETLIYSLEQDKLVWAARSQTTNPEKVGPFVKELTAKVAAELKKEGLVK
jgi:hypothetical protein